jgi:hypothetical protein
MKLVCINRYAGADASIRVSICISSDVAAELVEKLLKYLYFILFGSRFKYLKVSNLRIRPYGCYQALLQL